MDIAVKTVPNVHFILVQIPENLDDSIEKATGSAKQVLGNAIALCDSLNVPHKLTEIGKERIRRAGQQILSAGGGTVGDVRDAA